MDEKKYHAAVLILILAVVCTWSVLAGIANASEFNFYCNDDAYISFTYAKNLIHGRGLVFNPGEYVEGYTNFLWLMFLAPWMRLLPSIDVSILAIFWGSFFSVSVLILTYVLGYQQRGHHWSNLIAPLLLSADNTFHYWSVSGLENALQTAFVLGGLALLFRKGRNAMFVSGLLFALATMTRPDSGLFWAVGAGCLALRAVRPRDSGVTWRDTALLTGGFVALLAPFCAWKIFYYGDILPNTFYLHTGNRMARINQGASYFLLFLSNRFYVPILALAASVFGYSFRRAVLLMSLFAFCAYAVWIGGDFFPGSRFFYVILPIVYLLVQDAIVTALDASSSRTRALILQAAGAVALFSVIFAGSYGEFGEYRHFVRVWAEDDLQRIQLAKSFAGVARNGDSILAGPIGQVGYYSGMIVLDYWGVIDPHIAHLKSGEGVAGTPGHEKTDIQYLLNKKPTYIIFGVDPRHPPEGYEPFVLDVNGRRLVVLRHAASREAAPAFY